MNTLKIGKEFPIYEIDTIERVIAQGTSGMVLLNKEWIDKKVVVISGTYTEDEIKKITFPECIEKTVKPRKRKEKGEVKIRNGYVYVPPNLIHSSVTVILVDPI